MGFKGMDYKLICNAKRLSILVKLRSIDFLPQIADWAWLWHSPKMSQLLSSDIPIGNGNLLLK